jgi:hypothetical protein
VGVGEVPTGLRAATHRDDGSELNPALTGWDNWVSASSTRAYALGDPLLDWLRFHGEANGFERDTHNASYDPRTDFTEFIFRQGHRFEQIVLEHLSRTWPVLPIAIDFEEIRSPGKVEATFAAMASGVPIIYQGVLWDPEHHVYGAPDLLVRADILEQICPGTIRPEDVVAAPALGGQPHYRVVDVKFTGLHLARDGSVGNSGSAPAYKVQVFLYSRALGRLQGYMPPTAHLLGRSWTQGSQRGNGALDRLGSVPSDAMFNRDVTIESMADSAAEWVRRVRGEGGGWQVMPEPSIPELYPNLAHQQDGPWGRAKREIATALDDITLLWKVGPRGRALAHGAGIKRWTDERCSPASVGVTSDNDARILTALIDVNRGASGAVAAPARVRAAEDEWRDVPALEFFVDFETFSDGADDFASFPSRGGLPIIFMIGCGHVENGAWQFECFVAPSMSDDGEASMIDAWLAHMERVRERLAPKLEQPTLLHWSQAEVSTFESAFSSARRRHPERAWPDLRWFDLLRNVVRAEPFVVRGALGFGLKAVARAMHTHGLIETAWPEGTTDGLGAMVSAWWCYEEAELSAAQVTDLPLMQEIVAYNEVDCRVLCELLDYLRKHH